MTADQIAHERVKQSFERQGMLRALGVELVRVQVGLVELRLPYSDAVTQQQGGYHGGAMGALADVAAGYAGLTVAPPDSEVTTVEYKINFLASFQGGHLHAIGKVVRAGKRIIVTTAEVSHKAPDGLERDCALMQQTLAPVPKIY